jgi:hypothetical protein
MIRPACNINKLSRGKNSAFATVMGSTNRQAPSGMDQTLGKRNRFQIDLKVIIAFIS